MSRRIFAVMALALALLLALASAGHAQGPTLPVFEPSSLPPAPWRSGDGVWAAGAAEEEPEFLEVPIESDTFVASRYPYDWMEFNREEVLFFGADADLGHLRTLLRWNIPDRWSLPPNSIFVGAAIYLPISGQEPAADLKTSAYLIPSWYDEFTVNWNTQPGVNQPPLLQFTIGPQLGWYWFSVTDQVADAWRQGNYSLAVQLRGPETGGNGYKGMWAREAGGGDKPAPVLVIAYTPDRTPPTCAITPLPLVSASPIQLYAQCSDNSTYIGNAQLQVRQGGGAWQPVPEFSPWSISAGYSFEFARAMGGQTYEFRLRAADSAGNVSPWTPDGSAVTTVEAILPQITDIDEISWMRTVWTGTGSQRYPSYNMFDPGPVSSGIARTERAYVDEADLIWRTTNEWSEMVLQVGHRYTLYARAVDRAQNVGAWTKVSTVTAYAREIAGRVNDVSERPVAGLPLRLTPAALNAVATDAEGRYQAYLGSVEAHALSAVFPGYMLTGGATDLAAGDQDVTDLAHILVSTQNLIANGGFTQPLAGAWLTQGAPVLLQPRGIVNGNVALRMGATPEDLLLDQVTENNGCIAAAPDGSLHLAWVARAEGYAPTMLRYTWQPAGARTWQPLLELGEANSDAWDATKPACHLAAGADGRLHLVSLQLDGTWVYRSKLPGSGWSDPEPIPLQSARFMDLAAGPSGGAHLILTSDFENYADAVYYLMRYTTGGWSTPVRLPRYQDRTDRLQDAAFWFSPDRKRHVVYTEHGAYARQVSYTESADGQTWSAPILLTEGEPNNTTQVDIVQAPGGDLYAFWLQYVDRLRLFYARKTAAGWGAAQRLDAPGGPEGVGGFSIAIDSAGRWLVLLHPDFCSYDYGAETLFEGAGPGYLARTLTLPCSSPSAQLTSAGGVTALLRSTRMNTTGGLSPVLGVLNLSAQAPPTKPLAVSQQVVIPDGMAAPTLDWRAAVRCLDTTECTGVLRIELTDPLGGVHALGEANADWIEARTPTPASADLSAWRGQRVTITFRFEPYARQDSWAWLDDVRLGGVPLDLGVALARSSPLPSAGQPVSFALTARDHRGGVQSATVEVTWPLGWTLVSASVQPAASAPGMAQFAVPLQGGEPENPITFTLRVPAEAPRSTVTVAAQLGAPFAANDYTPADNRAELTLIVNGVPQWLPLLVR